MIRNYYDSRTYVFDICRCSTGIFNLFSKISILPNGIIIAGSAVIDKKLSEFALENEIGNFEPAFSSKSIFFADSEGTLSSIDISSGNINWSTELNFLASGTAAGFGIIVVADVDGNVIALDQKDGSSLWSTNVKGEVLSKSVVASINTLARFC